VLQDFFFSGFFHILCGWNKKADAKANMDYLMPLGALSKNDEAPYGFPSRRFGSTSPHIFVKKGNAVIRLSGKLFPYIMNDG